MTRLARRHLADTVLCAGIGLLLMPTPALGKTVYVDSTATGKDDGSSWANAYRYLQDALDFGVAAAGDEIWVAEGTYRPDQGNYAPVKAGDQVTSFDLPRGVLIYGGFPPGGGDWTQRDPAAHEVILSGDLAGNDGVVEDPRKLPADPNRADNSYHVVTGSVSDADTVLDGFTIAGGHAYGSSSARRNGGGLYMYGGKAIISNCRFISNSADNNGGAIYCRSASSQNRASPEISYCTILNNAAHDGAGMWLRDCSGIILGNTISGNVALDDGEGGGVRCREDMLLIVEDNRITDNAACRGGGMYLDGSCVDVRKNIIRANTAVENGGGICCDASEPTITGNTLEDNAADNGAGIWCKDSSPRIAGNVIAGNVAGGDGGGICCREGCSLEVTKITNNTIVGNVASEGGGVWCPEGSGHEVCNCILWDNVNGDLWQCGARYSCLSEEVEGPGNISTYPYFASMASGDYHLRSYSPCIDAGNDAEIGHDELDIDGDYPRSWYAPVDMGADEVTSGTSRDKDGDGLPDTWERVYFNGADGAVPHEDPDGDGATNLEEYHAGTYPAPGIDTAYVSVANADDPEADGSCEHPFSSIREAIDASLAHVKVAGGTYRESIVIDSKTLNIRGGYAVDFSERNPAEHVTILDAGHKGSAVTYRDAAGGCLEGFTITGGNAGSGGGIYCERSTPTVAYNHIKLNAAQDGGGIYCRGQGQAVPTIANNFITRNTAGDDGGGIFCDNGCSPVITNNTIVGNEAHPWGGGIFCKDDARPVITNCILWGNGIELRGEEYAVNFSCIEDIATRGARNISQYPHFVDPSGGDYHLRAYSPCIDAGNDFADAAGDYDIDGDDRIQLSYIDIGADEASSRSADADLDGLPDEWERLHFGGTSAPPEDDPDGDGLTTSQEFQAGTNPTRAAITRDVVYVSADNAAALKPDGSLNNPLASIQEAIHLATEKVLVAAGTYEEHIVIDAKTLGIVGGYDSDFAELDPAKHPTILDGRRVRGPVVTYLDCRGGSLSGFRITNGTAKDGGGILCAGSSVTIEANVIVGNRADDDGGGIYCKDNPSPIIRGNTIQGNEAGDNGGGLYCRDASLIAVNNMVKWNFANDGAGITCRDAGARLVNNTVFGNMAEDLGGGVYVRGAQGGVQTRIVNCIVWENVALTDGPQMALGIFELQDQSSAIISSCAVEGGLTSVYRETGCDPDWRADNLDVDPLLTVEGHLRSGSPCIDAGSPSEVSSTDIDGEVRPAGAVVDIGCDEFVDGDRDGLADWWETRYFGSFASGAPGADPDGDWLTNLEEYEDYGGNPNAVPIFVGPSDEPEQTLQHALDEARDGDTVLVSAGRYVGDENTELDFQGKRIVLHAYEGPDATVIDGEGAGNGFSFNSGETPGTAVVGFTITRTIQCRESHPQIRNCVMAVGDDPNAGQTALLVDRSIVTLRDCTIDGNDTLGAVVTEEGAVRFVGTVELASGSWVGDTVMLTGPGVLSLNPGTVISLDDSRIRSHICGPGRILVDEGSQLTVEGQAAIDLEPPGAGEPGTIECDGLLRVRDSAMIRNANIDVSGASFEGAAYVADSVIRARPGSPYSQFFIEDTAVIVGNEIHAVGDRYMDLDPNVFRGVMANNRIYVEITEGVGRSMGGLLEVRGAPDLTNGSCVPGAFEFSCHAEPDAIPDFDPNSWTLEELRLRPGAKINLTNRFDFQPPYDSGGEHEVLYVRNLVLEEGAVLNTAFNRVWYGTLDKAASAQVTSVPLLGFSLNNIAMDDETEFVVRVKHNNLVHDNPAESHLDRLHVRRVQGLAPDPNGMMLMQNLVDRDPTSSSAREVVHARAKGLFDKASESEILVLFEYLFETVDPNVQLVIHLTDVPRWIDPNDPARAEHYVEVGRIQPPPPGRPGAKGSGRFGVFHQYVACGHLNLIRGTWVELELIGPDRASVWINNWDPQVHCSGYCGDVTGDNGVTVLDCFTTMGNMGSRAELLPDGNDTTCQEIGFSKDGYVDTLDVAARAWLASLPGQILNLCDVLLMPASETRPIVAALGTTSSGVAAMASGSALDSLDALLVMGKRYVAESPETIRQDRLCVLDDEGRYLRDLDLDRDMTSWKLVKGTDDDIYVIDLVEGLIRLADGKAVVPPAVLPLEFDPRYGPAPAAVHVGLSEEDTYVRYGEKVYPVPAWVGRPILDAAFDGAGDLYVVPVVVWPDADANEPYEMAARLRLTDAGDPPYELVKLYGGHPPEGDNQYLNNLRAIEVDPRGDLYVLNADSINESDILWVFDAVTGRLKRRVALGNPNSGCYLPGAAVMHASKTRNELYLASSLNDPEATANIVYVLSTDSMDLVRTIEIYGMGHIADITEDESTGVIWVAGFTMQDIPEPSLEYVPQESFCKPHLAKIPSAGRSAVEAFCVWDRAAVPGNDLALPLAVLWTGVQQMGDEVIRFARFASQWRATGCHSPDWCGGADLNRDGDVTTMDLSMFCATWLDDWP